MVSVLSPLDSESSVKQRLEERTLFFMLSFIPGENRVGACLLGRLFLLFCSSLLGSCSVL